MLDLALIVGNHVGRAAGLDEDALYSVGLAIRESVINAITHGNGRDRSKQVFVEFALVDEARGIAIRVRDQGVGFDPATVPDPLAPENALKSSGRGVFLIRRLMDEMTLQRAAEGGTEIVMVKRAQHQAPQRDERSTGPYRKRR